MDERRKNVSKDRAAGRVIVLLIMSVFALGSAYASSGAGGPGPDSPDAQWARDVVFADSTELAGSDVNEDQTTAEPPATTDAFEAVPAEVRVLWYPQITAPGGSLIVEWELLSGGRFNVSHTGVHFGFQSGDYAIHSLAQIGKSPRKYTIVTTVPVTEDVDTVYFRVHALVDGKEYFSPEHTISIQLDMGGG
jgi:hypothetical protein